MSQSESSDQRTTAEGNLSTPASQRSPQRRFRTVLRKTSKCAGIAVACYFGVCLIGLIPVNNDFSESPDGVEIFVTSNAVHAAIIVPVNTRTIDWRRVFPPNAFPSDVAAETHVAIGWGDRGFFLQTPTWSDFRLSTAVNALFLPSSTCLHATMYSAVRPSDKCRPVRISGEQYERLVARIMESVVLNENNETVAIGSSYGHKDAFFEAHGTYHAFNTCNCWAGDVLRSTGVRVGWLTPLPKSVFLYLP